MDDEELICELCGNDLAVEHFRLCLDCLERLGPQADDWSSESNDEPAA